VFASLLRMTTKYGFSGIRDQLVHGIKGAYPTKWEGLGIGMVLGEDIFGSPKPHPNAVLNLFAEQGVKFALPFAAYQVALAGFSSLTSDEPGTVLPRLTLASTVYGMETLRIGLFRLAHLITRNMSSGACRNRACAEGSNKVYDAMIKERKGGMLFSLSLGDVVCVDCAKVAETAYQVWCTTVWEELPRIFRVGKSWEEL
jgi:hypothetical protein